MRRPITYAVCLLALGAAACQSSTEQQNPPEPRVSVYRADSGSTLHHAALSGFRDPVNIVVRDAATWSQVWAQAMGTLMPRPPAPGIDFGEDVVLVAAMGTAPSGGFGFRIDSITYYTSSQRVYLTRSAPGSRCATIGIITQPVHLVRVPRPVDNAVFEVQSKTFECS